jgi:hypothetical protein
MKGGVVWGSRGGRKRGSGVTGRDLRRAAVLQVKDDRGVTKKGILGPKPVIGPYLLIFN